MPRSDESRFRKTVEDVLVFALATAGAAYATLNMGLVGLAVGCVVLSAAAAVVVGRENGVHRPADAPSADQHVATDGGQDD